MSVLVLLICFVFSFININETVSVLVLQLLSGGTCPTAWGMNLGTPKPRPLIC